MRVTVKEKNLSSLLYLESLIIQTTSHTLYRNDSNLLPMYAGCLNHVMRRT